MRVLLLYSGYTINWSKSDFMPLLDYLTGFLESILPKLVNDSFRSLGFHIPENPKVIFKEHFDFISGAQTKY